MLGSVLVFAACFASAWVGLRIVDFFWRPLGVRPLGWTLSYSNDGPGATVSWVMPRRKAAELLADWTPGERHPVYPFLASTDVRRTGAFPSERFPLLVEVTMTYEPLPL